MLNPREENKSKLLQVFEQFQLSKEEQKITEDFFFKGADAQVLEQLLTARQKSLRNCFKGKKNSGKKRKRSVCLNFYLR